MSDELLDPVENMVPAFLLGVGIVLFTATMRLRYTWWPFHPVIFLVWGRWGVMGLVWSFLLGWLIKVVLLRTGGTSVYEKAKPFMVGLILGDLLGGLGMTVFNLVRYLWLDLAPIPYTITGHL